MTNWQPIGTIAPSQLAEARLHIHHAAQLLALGIGRSLLAAEDDDSHTTLLWDPAAKQWLSQPIPGTDGLRAGLSPADLTLWLGSEALPLSGRTREEALGWLRGGLGGHGVVNAAAVSLDAHYEMPTHPVADGAPFSEPLPTGCAELAAYFANAHTMISAAVAEQDEASPVVTWPHHFDLASLLTLGPCGDDTCSIGIGFSPGDGHVAEPYFYVTPFPAPKHELPLLPVGHWRREGFFGAVLPASELLEEDDRMLAVRRYLAAAVGASKQWLAGCADTADAEAGGGDDRDAGCEASS